MPTKKTPQQKQELAPKTGRATPKEAAKFLGISSSLLGKYARDGRIATTFAGSHRRYSWELLHAINKGEVEINGLTNQESSS
jgi:excisionase family DNA binding protein